MATATALRETERAIYWSDEDDEFQAQDTEAVAAIEDHLRPYLKQGYASTFQPIFARTAI